jgi:hypothetical protein
MTDARTGVSALVLCWGAILAPLSRRMDPDDAIAGGGVDASLR